MRFFITIAELFMLIMWGLLLTNLFHPFPDKIALIFYLLLGFVMVMHFLQLLVVYGAFSKKLKLTKSEALLIFIFGVFKLLQIKKRLG